MDKKTLAVVAGGAVIIILVAILILTADDTRTPNPGGLGPDGMPVGTQGPQTKFDVPANVTVPEKDSSVSADVAKPTQVVAAAPGVDSKKRTFSITINNDKFEPSTVIANVSDIAHIEFTAVDKDYEITQPDYGYRRLIKEGETSFIEGQFTTPGKYLLFCSSCGGPEKGPVGYLIAVP